MKDKWFSIWAQHHEKALIFADQAVVSGSNFLIGILISQVFGLHDLGVYAFAWMMLMICSSLQQSFISIPMVNEYAKKNEVDQHTYVGQLFWVQVALSLVLGVAGMLAILFLAHIPFFAVLQDMLWALPSLICSYTLYDFIRRLYFMRSHLQKALWIDLLINGAQVVFLLVNIQLRQFSLTETIWFFGFTYTIGLAWGFIGLLQVRHLSTALVRLAVHHWKLTGWLLASSILQWFAGNFFIISAGSLMGAEAAGVVRIAQSIVGVLNVFFIALELYAPIRFAHLYRSGGRKALFTYTRKTMLLGVAVCGAFVLFVALFSPSILSWLYGARYVSFSHVVTVFAAFYILVFIGYPLRFALRALENTRAMFMAYVFAIAFSLAFSNTMIHAWGIWGVLAGLAGTQLIMQAWYVKELIVKAT